MTDKERQNIMMSVIYATHDMLEFQTRQERITDVAYALEQIGVGYLKSFEFAEVIVNTIESHPTPRNGLIREVNKALEAYTKINMNHQTKDEKAGVA